jgi:hypothetical protein
MAKALKKFPRYTSNVVLRKAHKTQRAP